MLTLSQKTKNFALTFVVFPPELPLRRLHCSFPLAERPSNLLKNLSYNYLFRFFVLYSVFNEHLLSLVTLS